MTKMMFSARSQKHTANAPATRQTMEPNTKMVLSVLAYTPGMKKAYS